MDLVARHYLRKNQLSLEKDVGIYRVSDFDDIKAYASGKT